MDLTTKITAKGVPFHIAIILDGNGRWAKKRHLPRTLGHKQGSANLKTIAIECSKLGIKALSVYAFSTENWKRPKEEIDFLMKLPREFTESFKGQFKENDIRVIFSGRKDRISKENLKLLTDIEVKTKDREGMILNICFDYGSQTELVEAFKQISIKIKSNELKIVDIDEQMITNHLYTKELPPLDLMIRTSGEQRLSNFLLWQLAYSELYFTKKHWPEFNKKELLKAIDDFQGRNRKYGGLKETK
ncbi:MAG: isoprenyl transferase [Candidatus Izemoplasma sp.]